MESPASDDYVPTFYIGHHDSDRTRTTLELLRQAQDHNVGCAGSAQIFCTLAD